MCALVVEGMLFGDVLCPRLEFRRLGGGIFGCKSVESLSLLEEICLLV